MKKLLYLTVVIVILVGAFFVYTTRPVEAPPAEAPKSETDTVITPATTVWSVDTSRSSAQFELDEVLRGEPFHVVGETRAVTGDVSYDRSTAELKGLVSVDGATLKTDSTQRDGAIARLILHTTDEAKRFITFRPTGIKNIPKEPQVGTEYTFTLMGTLKINGISKDTTWTVTGKSEADGTLRGVAKATVRRGDFGLVIPNIPFVANVSEDVDLTFDFTFLNNKGL